MLPAAPSQCPMPKCKCGKAQEGGTPCQGRSQPGSIVCDMVM